MQAAFPQLVTDIERSLSEGLRHQRGGDEIKTALGSRAGEIAGKVIDPKVSKLIVALVAEIPEHDAWLQYAGQNIAGVPPEGWTDDDRKRFFTISKDVCAAFLRIEALNSDLRSRGSGFDAVRITLTPSTGEESIKLVWLDDDRRQAIGDLVNEAINSVARRTGSDDEPGSRLEARDLLLAALAELEIEDREAARDGLQAMRDDDANEPNRSAARKAEGHE